MGGGGWVVGGGGSGRVGGGGQGRCERRSEGFCLFVFFGGVGSGGGRVWGVRLVGEGGCVRVDVKEELMIFVKIQKKKNRGGGGGGSG